MLRTFLRLSVLGGTTGVALYNAEEIKNSGIGLIRFGRAAVKVASIVVDYKMTLYSGNVSADSPDYPQLKTEVHTRSAEKLLDLCCRNGGVFIKVGQHLGTLEYILPMEYVNTMKILHSNAPCSSLESIYAVMKQEFKCDPSEIFVSFDSEPLGAASLAQVHRATLKDGRQVAVKVQHPEVKKHSTIDISGMELLVTVVSGLFPDFSFKWLVKEMKENLPLELDFTYEAKNSEKIARQFSHFPWLKIPYVEWPLSSSRVFVMEYFDGCQITDLKFMTDNHIDPTDVADKMAKLYAEMIFVNGYVHCDPHPGNVLVRRNGGGTAEIILLDHGLYTTLNTDFRLTYGRFWRSVYNADLDGIRENGEKLGVGELFGLFACMVTARSWDSISHGINKKERTADEQNVIRNDAARYLPEISKVLSRVPRSMILIFKTNDLLRGIEFALNVQDSMRSFITMSRCCVRAMYNHERAQCTSALCRWKIGVSECWENTKISLFSVYVWCLRSAICKLLLGKRKGEARRAAVEGLKLS